MTGNTEKMSSKHMKVENGVEFLIDAGGIGLSAVVHLPDKTPAPVIVCSHGLLSTKENLKAIALGKEMSEAGFCVLRFDFSGCGKSPSRRGVSLVEARSCDLDAVTGFALEQPWSDGRIGLFGSSFGGFLSLLAADQRPEVFGAVVSLASPFDMSKIGPDITGPEELRTIFPDGFNPGSPKDLQTIGRAGRVLLIHGQLDEIVPWKDSVLIYERLCEPKRLLLMRTADHSISDEAWRTTAIKSSLEWFLTYLRC
jgi:alpha-beta hydrolase superfamily lysophospholipase